MAKLSADLANLTPEQKNQLEEKLKNMSPEQLAELQKQQCIFCQIISGKIPSKKIYEDNLCSVVMDINPASRGHLLILPKEHYSIMPQVPEKMLDHLFIISRNLSMVLLKFLKVDGTNVFIANGSAAGQRAQHFMVHLIPRKTGDQVLKMEEKLIDAGIVEKIKLAIGEGLKQIIGMKAAVNKEGRKEIKESGDNSFETEKEETKSIKPKTFVTSDSAKRYHLENCAFAQNIPAESKIILTEEGLKHSDKLPCTCVSGKKISLPRNKRGKKSSGKKTTKSRVKDEKDEKPKKTVKKTVKKIEKSFGKKEEPQKAKSEDISLDDIANLFK